MAVSKTALAAASQRIRLLQRGESIPRVLIVSHIRPDGDAVGSMLGLGLAMMDAGWGVQMVLEDGIPASLRHLEGSKLALRRAEGDFDLAITLDCSDFGRTGSVFNGRPGPDINIDHHITNTEFGGINLVDGHAAATAEMLVDFFTVFGLKLTRPVAAALLTGIITDTIGFRTPNVRPKTLRLAARLLQTGVDMAEIYRRSLVDRSYESVKFWGAGLNLLERQGRLVWTSLTNEDRKLANYPGRDDADLINVLSTIENNDISIIFVEQSNGNVKVSWRAQPGFDVSKIALEFGGGGHPAASGAEIQGSLTDVQAAVLMKTLPLLDGG